MKLVKRGRLDGFDALPPVGDQGTSYGSVTQFFQFSACRITKEAVDGQCVGKTHDEYCVGITGTPVERIDATGQMRAVTGE